MGPRRTEQRTATTTTLQHSLPAGWQYCRPDLVYGEVTAKWLVMATVTGLALIGQIDRYYLVVTQRDHRR
jgi:hypothetical protein